MKHLIQFSFIAALAISPLVHAANVDTVTVTPNTAELFTQDRYPMQADEFYKFKRAYTLSNGMTLSVYDIGSMKYAQLNDGARERIVATSHNTFVSTKSSLQMHINVQSDDEVNGEVFIPSAATLADSGAVQHGLLVHLR